MRKQPTVVPPLTVEDSYQFVVEIPRGTFVFRPLTLHEQMQIRRDAVKIYGEALPPPFTPEREEGDVQIALMLAELRLAAVEVPPDWDWETLYNALHIMALWGAYSAQLEAFLKGLDGDPLETSEGDGAESELLVSAEVPAYAP